MNIRLNLFEKIIKYSFPVINGHSKKSVNRQQIKI